MAQSARAWPGAKRKAARVAWASSVGMKRGAAAGAGRMLRGRPSSLIENCRTRVEGSWSAVDGAAMTRGDRDSA
ncbi:hypothetical protein D3C72_1409100 [compost metagenome]